MKRKRNERWRKMLAEKGLMEFQHLDFPSAHWEKVCNFSLLVLIACGSMCCLYLGIWDQFSLLLSTRVLIWISSSFLLWLLSALLLFLKWSFRLLSLAHLSSCLARAGTWHWDSNYWQLQWWHICSLTVFGENLKVAGISDEWRK